MIQTPRTSSCASKHIHAEKKIPRININEETLASQQDTRPQNCQGTWFSTLMLRRSKNDHSLHVQSSLVGGGSPVRMDTKLEPLQGLPNMLSDLFHLYQ